MRNLQPSSCLVKTRLDLNENVYGIHGDGETRRFFTGFGYKRVINNIQDFTEQYFQVGIAPYVGEYGYFHTWVMLKGKKKIFIQN